jgi:hypothetical protein
MSETPQPPQIPRPDLKLEACEVFATGPTPILVPIKTPCVIVPLVGLQHNIRRLKSLILAPARLSFLAAYMMNLYARAELEKTGNVSDYDPTAEMKSSPDISARVAELFLQERQKLVALAGTPEAETKRLKRLLDGTNILQMFPIDFGVEAMLWSYITGMWTAFETMAGDLWEQALNLSPENLATLSGDKGQGKSISPDLIKLYGFDLRKKMGTVLRREKYGGLHRLSDIKNAYRHAFADDADAIMAAVNNPALGKLSAVRSLIVHKAGIVDQTFVDRTKNFDGLPIATLGEPLPIDGQFVADLLRSTTSICFELLKSVDEWIERHNSEAK